jgi:hypothetical protein
MLGKALMKVLEYFGWPVKLFDGDMVHCIP